MTTPVKTKYLKKVLLVTRSKELRHITQFMLQDKLFCLTMSSAPDAKVLFKSSTATSVLILDWSLQDKYDSIYKCLAKAKVRKNIIVVNVLNSSFKKKWLLQKMPNLKKNKNIYFVTNEFLSISLMLTLLKIRNRLPSLKH